MIRRMVSAVLLLRDGFTGQTLTNGSATRCLLDGRLLRQPIWKRDGYLVLTDLKAGPHILELRRNGYQVETVPLQVNDGTPIEDTVALKPGPGYRFPPETVRVTLALRRKGAAAGERIWLGMRARPQLKLAQEKTASGDSEARLFCEGNAALLPIPGHFLFSDGKAPELAYLRSLHDEAGEFAPPLQSSHNRGTELIPMQAYALDGSGALQVLLREPGTLVGFADGTTFEAQLHAGEQTVEWKLGD